jgi:hypothetical protein
VNRPNHTRVAAFGNGNLAGSGAPSDQAVQREPVELHHSSLNASDSVVSVGCRPGKQLVATGSTVDDSEMGQWYLDRVSPYSTLQNRAVGEATRHEGLTSVTQSVYSICVDKK